MPTKMGGPLLLLDPGSVIIWGAHGSKYDHCVQEKISIFTIILFMSDKTLLL